MKVPLLFLLMAATLPSSGLSEDVPFYVGTSTGKTSKGIYFYRLNTTSGVVSGGTLAVESQNPTFLAAHPSGKYLYAANEVKGGAVSAFRVQADGSLARMNQQQARGDGTCHIAVDPSGRVALVANYESGSAAVLPIGPDGSLGEVSGFDQHSGASVDRQRQKGPHAHSFYTDATGRFAYCCDLGTDKVYVYKLDAEKGTLTANEPAFAPVAPGSGPRHLAFDPTSKHAYVINEMLNTITVFAHNATKGSLRETQVIRTLPADFTGSSTTAEIFVHPNGKFLYGSNRGHDSIAVFAVGDAGQLSLVEHASTKGKGPRNFALDPTGKFLIAANQGSNDMTVFRIDGGSGKLTPIEQTLKIGEPMCVTFLPPAK